MTTTEDIRARTLAVIADYQTYLLAKTWDAWIALWAEDAVLEFPYGPPTAKTVYRGHAEILGYMRDSPGWVVVDSIETYRLFPCEDPNAAVAELSIKGHVRDTGAAYDQKYVLFFELKDGLIHRYREYWNPAVTLAARGQTLEEFAATFGTSS